MGQLDPALRPRPKLARSRCSNDAFARDTADMSGATQWLPGSIKLERSIVPGDIAAAPR
jgi:hypothetical protein